MKEAIIKLTSDHIKVKNGEYVQDLVRCKDCRHTKERATKIEEHKYCPAMVGWVEDNFFCGYGEVRDE